MSQRQSIRGQEKISMSPQLHPVARLSINEKLAFWLEKVWQHIPKQEKPAQDANETLPAADPTEVPPDYYTNLAAKKFKPDELFHTRASLMGRDADFSWFRFVIPAGRIMRDDLQVGNHEFIPIDTK